MINLEKDVQAAERLGISYGKYTAMTQQKKPECPQNGRQKRQKRQKQYNDRLAFELWQEGKTDAEIASVFGVSRTIIQRWRDTMELPSTSKRRINTKKYRLEENPDGTYVVIKEIMVKRRHNPQNS